jgi:DNA-binding NtrC family response regulator
MALFSVESETGAVLTYRLAKSQISVGSAARNDIVVRSPGVADRHLVMHRSGEVFTFVTVDRLSVVLNGERRARGVLNVGERVRIGGASLTYRAEDDGAVEFSATAGEGVVAEAPVDDVIVRPGPAPCPDLQRGILELFCGRRADRLPRALALARQAAPEVSVSLLAVNAGEAAVVLASIGSDSPESGDRMVVEKLTAPGRWAAVSDGTASTAFVPVFTPHGELAAVLAARPLAAIGDEALALLGELAFGLGLHWLEPAAAEVTPSAWELEARHRLETLLPGSSQAIQVLRAGLLTAAHGLEPVLICGADGCGRTEVARILATVGPIAGRPVVVFDAREGEIDRQRAELLGSPGRGGDESHPGAVGRAKGGVLVVRHADCLPAALQDELAPVIAASQREGYPARAMRWVVTCGEDPLALVQQGRFTSSFFMVFSQRMLRVPRLAERREDLPLLIAALLRRVAAEQQKNLRGITLECLNVFLARPFAGEMAELVGEINRLVTATADGELVTCDPLGVEIAAGAARGGEIAAEAVQILSSDNLKEVVPRVEQLLIDRVMRRVKGNQSKGAELLGISRGALIAKLKEYAIPDYRYLRRRGRLS